MEGMTEGRLLLQGARQVVRVGGVGQLYKKGKDMNQLNILTAQEGSSGISLAVDRDGVIAGICPDDEVAEKFRDCQFERTEDVTGCILIPGLVDGHTHPVWAGDRVHEFAMKVGGASYMEVQKAGGGIHFTVSKTKQASDEELLQSLLDRLNRMLHSGTTLAEVKSGYGLSTAEELRLLRVLHRASKLTPLQMVPTYLGAHAVPPGLDAEEATRLVLEEQIPALLRARDKGEVMVSSMDVFCETGVFSVEQSRRILDAGRRAGGLMINAHVDELTPIGGAKMAAELNAEAVSHCEEVDDEGIAALATSGTVAVLLPTTQLLLQLPAPPARDMIQQGVIIGLGSDFNPNAHCLSMPTVLHLACVMLRMSPAEALCAATLNAAHSVRRSGRQGALQPTMVADILVLDAPRWDHLVYQLGEHHSIIRHVICGGRVVHSRTHAPPHYTL